MEPTASILAGLLALAFLAAGGAKLVGADQMVTVLRGLGVGEGLQRAIGALEVLAAAAWSWASWSRGRAWPPPSVWSC